MGEGEQDTWTPLPFVSEVLKLEESFLEKRIQISSPLPYEVILCWASSMRVRSVATRIGAQAERKCL
jgi:hypothetical protein